MDKIYRIELDGNYALADIVESLGSTSSLDLTPNSVELFSSFRYGWITEESAVTPDVYIIMSEMFCCKKNKSTVLERLLPMLSKSLIKVGEIDSIVFYNIPSVSNAINLRSSKVSKFNNGDIMSIDTPVFNRHDYPLLFTVPEMDGVFFCTENFVEAIDSDHLTGLKFQECRIKSKFWL